MICFIEKNTPRNSLIANKTKYSEPIDTSHTEGFALGMEASQEKTPENSPGSCRDQNQENFPIRNVYRPPVPTSH